MECRTNYEISWLEGISMPIAYLSAQFVERIIIDNNLYLLERLPIRYKFGSIDELTSSLLSAKIGKILRTPLGAIVLGESKNFIIVSHISNKNQAVGLYINFDILYNADANLKNIKDQLIQELIEHTDSSLAIEYKWYYVHKDDLTYSSFYDNNTITIYDEAYPFVDISVNKYLDNYRSSLASVLLLIGPPGTGKTKFIKYMVQKYASEWKTRTNISITDKNNESFQIMYSNSQRAYDHDELFMAFIDNDCQLLILEDIDFNLSPRIEGNNYFMHKLLNASDGLLNIGSKKIIITTNIHGEQKIDNALLRPGRTFDILRTRNLTLDEAKNLSEKLEIPFILESESNTFSLAEIYNSKKTVQINKGFK